MKSTDSRDLFTTLIGASAATTDITSSIPTSQATTGDGKASLDLGFPPENFISRSAGGIPPYGADMNGFLHLFSSAIQALQTGYFGQFDSDFASAIGGYPSGAVVCGSTAGTFWVSTSDDNTSTPGATGATWQSLFKGLIKTATIDTTDTLISIMSLAESASSLGATAKIEDPSGTVYTFPSTTYLTNYSTDFIKTQVNVTTDNLISYICGNYSLDAQGPYLYIYDKNAHGYTVPSVIKTTAMISAAIEAKAAKFYPLSSSNANVSTSTTSVSFTPSYDGYILINSNVGHTGTISFSTVTVTADGAGSLLGGSNFGNDISLWAGSFYATVTSGTEVTVSITANTTASVPVIDINATILLIAS